MADLLGSWCATSSPASQIRMPSSNDSIEPIAPKCSMPMYSSRWIRFEKSVRNGSKVTTKSGPMMRWRGSHQHYIGPNWKLEVLHWPCRLDGEAYIKTRICLILMILSHSFNSTLSRELVLSSSLIIFARFLTHSLVQKIKMTHYSNLLGMD